MTDDTGLRALAKGADPVYLPVLLAHDIISDGQVPRPEVGVDLAVALTFSEHESWPSELVDTFPATARRHGRPSLEPGRNWDGTPRDRPPVWPTTLYGDRWRAHWPARREIADAEVLVRGVMTADYGALSSGRARGRIVRVRLVTAALAPSPDTEMGWTPIPGRTTIRTVEKMPSRLDPDYQEPPEHAAVHVRPPSDGSAWITSYGALVDLVLDPLRPEERLAPAHQ